MTTALLLFGFSLAAGEDQEAVADGTGKAPAVAHTAIKGAKFSVYYDNPSYLDSPGRVTLTVQDTGKKKFALRLSIDLQRIRIQRSRQRKKTAPLTRYGKTIPRSADLSINGTLRPIRPGGKFEMQFELLRAFDLSIPGDYTFNVRAERGFIFYDDKGRMVIRPLEISDIPLTVKTGPPYAREK